MNPLTTQGLYDGAPIPVHGSNFVSRASRDSAKSFVISITRHTSFFLVGAVLKTLGVSPHARLQEGPHHLIKYV
jgi:hypothetical protein